MKFRTIALLVLLLLAEKGYSDDGLVLQADLQLRRYEVDERDDSFFFRFSDGSRNILSEQLRNLVHPSRVIYWDLVRTNSDFTLVKQSHVIGAMSRSLREIASDIPIPANTNNWFVRVTLGIARGVVGNTTEEDVRVDRGVSPNYSLDAWLRQEEHETFEYGFRPWRSDPYYYISGPLGRYEGRRLVKWLVRYRAKNLMDQKLEAFLSVALPEDWVIEGGFSYTILDHFRPEMRATVGTIGLAKQWDFGSVGLGFNLDKQVFAFYECAF